MRSRLAILPVLAFVVPLGGCSLTSTANQWHGRVGPNGKPVYVKTHTNIGLNFAIVVPFLGATSLPEQVDELTDEIATENGDTVRMVESTSENYWYGFPPFTWIFTPVITSVAADYEPSAGAIATDEAERNKAGK